MSKDLKRWSPARYLDRLFDDDFFSVSGFSPVVDIYEEKDNIIVETPLAGVNPENVDIVIENDILSISGETEENKEIKKENYYRKELRQGSFYRSISLPMPVKANEVMAESNNGMLKIIIPKLEKSKNKKVAIKIKPAGRDRQVKK